MLDTSKLAGKISQGLQERMALSEDGRVVCVKKQDIIELLKVLKDGLGFGILSDITAAEYEDRMEVVYQLTAMGDAQVLRIKAETSLENPSVPTASKVWRAAEIMEREIYDLMGVNFEGHPGLRRILCPEDFEGHPLRKAFKLDNTERFT